ncbi:MAG: tyrosine-protein phosphatase [Pseudooceanicola sp.]
MFRRRSVRVLLAIGAVFLVLATWRGYLELTGNVHEVRAGMLYRSAQLSPDRLEEVIAAHGIKSVLNLRGAAPDAAWWRDEVAVARASGVVHADLELSAWDIPDDDRIAELMRLLETLPQPLLIHCQSGADRSGLAAALFLAKVAGASERQAEWQMSFYYGHVSSPTAKAWPMDQIWERLEPGLGYEGS